MTRRWTWFLRNFSIDFHAILLRISVQSSRGFLCNCSKDFIAIVSPCNFPETERSFVWNRSPPGQSFFAQFLSRRAPAHLSMGGGSIFEQQTQSHHCCLVKQLKVFPLPAAPRALIKYVAVDAVQCKISKFLVALQYWEWSDPSCSLQQNSTFPEETRWRDGQKDRYLQNAMFPPKMHHFVRF